MYTLALNYQTAFEMQDISYLLNPVSNIFESSENTVRFCLISAHEVLKRDENGMTPNAIRAMEY